MWTVNGKPWYTSWPIVFMVVVAIVESAFAYIQAIKTFQRKSAEDLSLIAFVVLLLGNLMWMLYAAWMKDIPIMIEAVLMAGGALLVIIAIFMYGENLS